MCRLTHTLRETNECAVFLPKHGVNHNSSWCSLENPILGLEDLLLADASRVQFLRVSFSFSPKKKKKSSKEFAT